MSKIKLFLMEIGDILKANSRTVKIRNKTYINVKVNNKIIL